MQKLIYSWLAFCLSLGVFASCSEDRNEPSSATEGGERVSLGLYAEVSVDDSEARAIDYKLGKNAKGQIVPMPQFEDKQEVEVHTIIKSNKGAYGVKTLKWLYDAEKKKLVLAPTDREDSSKDLNDIVIENFNNDNDTKWYISGLIGGVLNGTKVEFMGTRVLKGVDGNAGDALGSMEVPYAFGWTELTINTEKGKGGSNETSYKSAYVAKETDVKFQPLGAMIAVKLGTNQSAGDYTFTPDGFTIASAKFHDQGAFDLNTAIPSSDSFKVLPTWTSSACIGSMYYTFADGEAPGTIDHGQTAKDTYYVWLMPYVSPNSNFMWNEEEYSSIVVCLKGKSSRPETGTYKDYTNTWFTDYRDKSSTRGEVAQGRVYTLTAKATHRVPLPIEYVTEYNLAGGEGFTFSPSNMNPQPDGVTGSLRFADSHSNDQSGYYPYQQLMGVYDHSLNRDSKNLLSEIDATFGPERYYVPAVGEWAYIFPWGSYRHDGLDNNLFSESLPRRNRYDALLFIGRDLFTLREKHSILGQGYLSDYSAVYSQDRATSDAVVYAIRFKSGRNPLPCEMMSTDDQLRDPARAQFMGVPVSQDNRMKCAYRYRRVGGTSSWFASAGKEGGENLTNQLIVDVVYLGEEATEDLDAISNDAWWSTKLSEGKVFSRTFPAAGIIKVRRFLGSGRLFDRGATITYTCFMGGEKESLRWDPYSFSNTTDLSRVVSPFMRGGMFTNYIPVDLLWAKPVRLFKRLDNQ